MTDAFLLLFGAAAGSLVILAFLVVLAVRKRKRPAIIFLGLEAVAAGAAASLAATGWGGGWILLFPIYFALLAVPLGAIAILVDARLRLREERRAPAAP